MVVLVFSQHAYEGHHPRHEAAPAGTQTEVFRFVDHLIHRHHGTFHEGILRKARHGIRILADIGLAHLHPLVLHVGHVLVLHRTSGFKRRVCHPLFERRTDTHSASQAWTVFLRRSASLPQHPHAALHVETRGDSISPCHRTDIGRHLVHHVVRKMTVQHPISGVVGNELHIARLRHSYEYGVSRTPRGLWLSSSFRARDDKLMAMKMDRMVVHSQIDEADADALPVPYDERSVGWTGFSVEGEPVELHVHGVRHLDVRQDGVLLHNDCEVFIGARLV